jgi:CheY-like chemotaxis protein
LVSRSLAISPRPMAVGSPSRAGPARAVASRFTSRRRLLPSGGRSILIVDDDVDTADTLTDILQANQYEVATAHSGDAAVSMARRRAYDLVLMDIQMPVMDGVQATNRIRAMRPPKRDIPIIALTADALRGAGDRYRGAGMDGYLSKPLSAKALSETMNALVSEERQRPSAGDRLPALDEGVIDALRVFLKPDQLEALLTETLAELGTRMDRLGSCLDTANVDDAAQEAHDLVSVSGNCGACALSATAGDVERACRQGLITEAIQDFARMRGIAVDAAMALTAVRDALTMS